jgi:hypothetical protein
MLIHFGDGFFLFMMILRMIYHWVYHMSNVHSIDDWNWKECQYIQVTRASFVSY